MGLTKAEVVADLLGLFAFFIFFLLFGVASYLVGIFEMDDEELEFVYLLFGVFPAILIGSALGKYVTRIVLRKFDK